MALPANISLDPGNLRPTGIQVGLFPSTTRGVPIELQHSTGATAASSRWISMMLPPSTVGPLPVNIRLPLSTQRTYIRARHTGGGYGPGAFTPTISATPVVLPWIIKPIPLNAAGNLEVPGANVLLTSANTVKTGSQNSTSYLSRTLRISFNQVLPVLDTETWAVRTGYLAPGFTGVTRTYYGAMTLPKGVTITSFATRMRRGGSGGSADVRLKKASSAGVETNLATNTATTSSLGSFATLTTSTISQLVGDEHYYSVVSLFTTANSGSGETGFMWAEVGYQRPSFEKVV